MTINERACARMWNKERTRLEAEIGKRDEAIAHLQIALERAAHEVSYGTPVPELDTIKQWMREAFEVIESVEPVVWGKSKRDELVARAMRQIEVAESTPDLEESDPDLEESDPDLEPDPPRNDAVFVSVPVSGFRPQQRGISYEEFAEALFAFQSRRRDFDPSNPRSRG